MDLLTLHYGKYSVALGSIVCLHFSWVWKYSFWHLHRLQGDFIQ